MINFKTLYLEKPLNVAWFERWEGKAISEQSTTWLERAYTIEEIKSSVFALPNDKAPSPDGFPIAFYQECRNIIKDDLFSFFSEIHSNGKIPKGINSTL